MMLEMKVLVKKVIRLRCRGLSLTLNLRVKRSGFNLDLLLEQISMVNLECSLECRDHNLSSNYKEYLDKVTSLLKNRIRKTVSL